MQTIETTTSSPNSNNAVLEAGVVSEIADQYEEHVRIEELYQEEKRQKIKELEQTFEYNRQLAD